MKNPLVDAADRISEHFDTLQVGSTVTEQFISEHQALVQNLRTLVDTYLIEAYQAEEGHKVRTNAYNELQKKLDDAQTKSQTP
jgi:hypothetical protein